MASDAGSRDDGGDDNDGDGGALKPKHESCDAGSAEDDAANAVVRGLERTAADDDDVALVAFVAAPDSTRSDCEANRAGSQSLTCRRAIWN